MCRIHNCPNPTAATGVFVFGNWKLFPELFPKLFCFVSKLFRLVVLTGAGDGMQDPKVDPGLVFETNFLAGDPKAQHAALEPSFSGFKVGIFVS